ncbi:MAG TPA: hypothetical protein VH396_18155, partial [Chitinophagaceae bacterium]
MKKFLLLVLIIFSTGIVLYFIPITQGKTYIIKSNFDNTLSSLNKPANWEKWHPFVRTLSAKDFKTFQCMRDSLTHSFRFLNSPDSMVVKAINPLLYNVEQYNERSISSYAYQIIPSSSTNSITIRTIEKVPLLSYLFALPGENKGNESVLALKAFLENEKAFYGYNIQIEKVRDTVFAVTTLTISQNDLFKTLPKEFSRIDTYIKEKNLIQKNFASVSYNPTGDSLELILGIPVNKFATGNKDIKCVNIPKGRMLTGNYRGKFGEREKIYETFRKYTHDHYLEDVG